MRRESEAKAFRRFPSSPELANLAMLFIGVSMVASLGDYHRLVAIHRPLGIMILILAAIRFVNRMCTTLPPFPPTMSR